MNSAISITQKHYDDGIVELVFDVSDGNSRFVNSTYANLAWSKSAAEELARFSHQVHGGIYDLTAGESGPEFAGGAFHARFHYQKPTALYVSTFQQSAYIQFKGSEVASEARMFLRTEPGLLDEFVSALHSLELDSAAAQLRCIPLHGA